MSRRCSGESTRSELGVTLPHEHTQIALWHVESRWDYWQLTRDEPVILAELERFGPPGAAASSTSPLPGSDAIRRGSPGWHAHRG